MPTHANGWLLDHAELVRLVDERHQFIIQLFLARDDDVVRPAPRIRLHARGYARKLAAVGEAEGDQQVFLRPTAHAPLRRRSHGKDIALAKGDLRL